jgi:hypothetical protein
MTSEQPSSSVARFLLPSVRDIIFIFLFWSILAGPLSNRPLADADIGWQIRTGELILNTHALPRTDPFSSAMQGQPWFAWEWLYDVLLAVLHHAAGLNGVVWLCALLVAGVFALLLSELMRRGTGLLLAIFLMLLAEAASTIHLYARPHIASWLFSLLWFVVLDRWEGWDSAQQGRLPRWIFWFFPVSMLLWVNLHGGWLFGMALLAAFALAACVESLRSPDAFARIRAGHRARAIAWAWIISAAASLANPFGWRLHWHIYHYLTDRYLMDRIDEFHSPDFHGWAQRCFAAMLLLLVMGLAGNRKRVRLSELLVVLLATYAAFYSTRNLPVSSTLLALIAGPILWQDFVGLEDRPGAWRWLRTGAGRIARFSERMGMQEMDLRGHLWPVVAVVLAFAVCLRGGEIGSHSVIRAQFDPQKMPVGAVNFLERENVEEPPGTAPIFSTDSWGGYLIYRMYPGRKVVVDDRHDLHGAERIRQYLTLARAEEGWRNVLEGGGDGAPIRTILFPAGSTLVNLLRELPSEWRVVYEDKVAVVLERR